MTRTTSICSPRRTGIALFTLAALLAFGSASAARRPQNFTLNYCWGSGWPSFSVCPEANLVLYSNHTVVAIDPTSGATGTGTWSTGSRGRITFTFPEAVYTGMPTNSRCYQGTMTSPNVYGGGSWAGCFVP